MGFLPTEGRGLLPGGPFLIESPPGLAFVPPPPVLPPDTSVETLQEPSLTKKICNYFYVLCPLFGGAGVLLPDMCGCSG